MSSQPLVRTTYEDQTNTPRGGNTGRGESRVDMEQYYQFLEQIHGSGLHSWGIATGLKVTVSTSPAGLQISPGIGLDANGKHISLAAGGKAEVNASPAGTVASLAAVSATGVTFPTPTNSAGDQYLTIEWRETFDDATWISSGGQTFQKLHTPWLRLQPLSSFPTPTSVLGQQLILGRVTLDASGTVTNLTPEYRRMTGLPVGGIQLQKATATPAPNLALDSGQAGSLQALATGGLALTVPNATDEIHLERDDGSNFAKVSLGAEKIVARQGTGTESVVIDSEAGSLTASGGITASSTTVNGPISVDVPSSGSPISAFTLDVESFQTISNAIASYFLQVRDIGAAPPSGLTHFCIRGDGNIGIGTPSPSNQLVLASQASFGGNTSNTGTEPIEVQGPGAGVSFYDRTGGSTGRWVIYSDRTGGAGTETLRLWSSNDKVAITQEGNISTSGSIDSSGLTASTVSAGIINANGEVLVKNAPGTSTIVLDGNGAMIDVGAAGADGGITIYNASNQAVCTINGQNGKISAKILKASGGVTSQGSGGGWALGGFAGEGAVGLRAAYGGIQADLGTSQWAGDFTGSVNISGGLRVSGPIFKGGGGFKIDHPLDPENKYLAHSFVESPDMKNIYDGVAVLDVNGEAIVELPAWFAALNRDVRYQLTCIGNYAPVYIAQKMQDNSFRIAGGKPEMEVSWQVTGIRRDAWACAHRLCTEEEKPPAEQGYYLHPEENGADAAMSIQQIRRSQPV